MAASNPREHRWKPFGADERPLTILLRTFGVLLSARDGPKTKILKIPSFFKFFDCTGRLQVVLRKPSWFFLDPRDGPKAKILKKTLGC